MQSSLGDEEIHVVASMLRGNITIEELQLRRNKIGDDGAKAIAGVLAEPSAVKFIDLRENNISMIGIKAIAEALERSERIQKVFVHPGGKIEGMGATNAVSAPGVPLDVSTICVVDIRENHGRDIGQKASVQKVQDKTLMKMKPGSPFKKQRPRSKNKTSMHFQTKD